MAIIMDGVAVANLILEDVKNDLADLKTKCRVDIVVKLVVVLVGHNAASLIYVNNKIKKAKHVGMDSEIIKLDESVQENELLDVIDNLNNNSNVCGIIVQLPLPSHINYSNVITRISPEKDVDGFHPLNIGYLNIGLNQGFIASTALGCLHLLKHYVGDLKGKNVVIIGRSNIVGKPLATLLLQNNCTVSICHSFTRNLSDYTTSADIVISAVGKPAFLTKEYFSANLAFVDVGINYIVDESGKQALIGDGDFIQIRELVSFITPVPGGVGPMTIAYLIKNTLTAAARLLRG